MVSIYIHIRNRVIITKVTSALSMVSSSFIMRDVYRRRKRGEIPLTSSLVFLMSCYDFFFSFFVTFLNSWMVPKETGAYLAAGNKKTCTAQGFLSVFFLLSTLLTNASLAVAYCLEVTRRRMRNDSHRNIIRTLHVLPPLVSFCLAVAALLDGAYNFSGGGLCDIAPYPSECLSPESDIECTRGQNAEILKKARLGFAVASNIVIIVSIILLIRAVFVQEQKMDNYTSERRVPSREYTRKTTWQGIWYIAAFELTYGPWYIWQILFLTSSTRTSNPKAAVVSSYILAVLFPSQGSWNALVYFRPRYKSLRRRHMSDSRLSTVTRLLRLHTPVPDVHSRTEGKKDCEASGEGDNDNIKYNPNSCDDLPKNMIEISDEINTSFTIQDAPKNQITNYTNSSPPNSSSEKRKSSDEVV